MKDTIFVQIASYRDPECKHTIDDLFLKADNPERIFVGLNWQYAEEDDDIPFFDKPYTANIRPLRVPYTESQGCCWARSQTQSLYRGEAYTMQIDAHMRFVQGWDAILLEMIKALREDGYAKPVISHHPPNYMLDGTFDDQVKKSTAVLRTKDRIFVGRRTRHIIPESHDKPVLSAYFVGCFFFADARCIDEVPYDPYLYFLGEEMAMTVRLFTNGWDIFNPGQVILHHLYKHTSNESGEKEKTRQISLHQADNDARIRNALSKARVRHLLGTDPESDPLVLEEIEKYGLGGTRTLHQYEQFSGINFVGLSRRVHLRTGDFSTKKIPLGSPEECKLLQDASLRQGNAALGSGSTIWQLVRSLDARSILHLGCVTPDARKLQVPQSISYHGLDIHPENVSRLRTIHHRQPNTIFSTMNCVAEPLPRADIIHTNDLLSKLPEPLVWQVLQNIVRTRGRFLSVLSPDDTSLLEQEPYYFPEPIVKSNVEGGGYLHLWLLPDIALYADALENEESLYRSKLVRRLKEDFRVIRAMFERYRCANFFDVMMESIPLQSRSLVRNRMKEGPIKDLLQTQPGVRERLHRIIDLRFQSGFQKHNAEYTMLDKRHSLLTMLLICEYCELSNRFREMD